AGGNGGNITVGDGFIIAIPGSNSDITANAFEGNGGRIAIATQGLLGIDFRENLTPLNDITASSQFGLDGNVVIEQFNPDIEPTDTVLPDQLASTDQITARCAAPANPANSLITTGRGGLPTDPRQLRQGSTILHDWRRPGESAGEITAPQLTHETLSEAQDWFVDDRGQVQLVASVSPSVSLNAPACATAREAL
ncbi:S-layer family protein, partial [Leptolyngbya cf. ectocarpi LEGE 11479]|nr:S-layer family protein [Leptolyngbya cf. ectocarpi LEGE 11479]